MILVDIRFARLLSKGYGYINNKYMLFLNCISFTRFWGIYLK